ncbi:uncharacterized protein LOC144860976 [Branchiostoma floridae x Branchiostoma japonicum]
MATDKIPCPCSNCKGASTWEWTTVRKHVKKSGIWPGEEMDNDDTGDDNIETDFLKSLHGNGRDKPLADGISTTLLEGVSILQNLHNSYPGTSQAFMTDLLKALANHFLAPGNILPRTFPKLQAVIADLLTPMEKIPMCKNKCVLYIKERANLLSCPKCNEPRSSKYTYPYIPITPRIERWMSIPEVAKALQSHLSPVTSESERMTDIQQSPAFTEAMERMQDRRCIAFGLNTDGVAPFNHLHVNYSFWPILLKTFNLPPEVRDSFGFTLLVSMIRGPDSPTDMNPFMEPLVDELLKLDAGVTMYDAHRKEWFTMRAQVIMTMTDMPAGHKLHKTTNGGALLHSCWTCEQPGQTVSAYHQVLYLGNEKFLPLDSPLRAMLQKPGEENESAPRKKRKEEVYAYGRAVEDAKERVRRGETTARALEQIEKATGKKGMEELHRLPYYDPVVCRPVDMMHASQVVVNKITALIDGHMDPFKTLEAEHSMGRFTDIEGRTGGRRRGQVSYPPWALDKDGLRIADKRCLEIQVPHGFGWRPKPFYQKTPHMKSHEWMKIGTCNVLTYTLHGLLGVDQMESLRHFMECLRDMTLPEISANEARGLKTKINVAAAEMELHWPLRFNTIMPHVLHHVPDDTLHFGPARSRWLFGPERYNSFISKRITKRDTPEINAMERIRNFDLTQLLAHARVIPEDAILTDPDEQLKAVAAARRELDGRLETDQEEEEDEGAVQVEEPSAPGLAFLTSQFRRPHQTTLSEEEVAMVAIATNKLASEVTREVTRYYSARLRRPRKQVLSCALVDKPTSHVCSSYIGVLSARGSVMFGRILYFVEVNHAELALVQWHAAPQLIEGLWCVDSRGMACHPPSFVRCRQLPPALVTARESANRYLYFLDANVSRMPTLSL